MATKRTQKKARGARRTSTKEPLTLPPLAVAIARLADQMTDGLPAEFLSAYALMPAFIAKLQAGDDGDARFRVIYDVSGLEWAEREAEKTKEQVGGERGQGQRDDRMVRAIAVLNDAHEDLLADFTTPIMDGAFFAGAAYACYMLAHGGSK